MHGAVAMQGRAAEADAAQALPVDPAAPAEDVIDLTPSAPDAASLYAPVAHAEAVPAALVVADPEQLAAVAAEVAETVARHRDELAAAMAELTELQRTLRSEVRAVVAELDRIAAGIAPAAVEQQADESRRTEAPPKRARWRLRAARA